MKHFVFVFLVSFLLLLCGDHKTIVEELIEARNDHNFNAVEQLLDEGYREYFANGAIELDSLAHLEERMKWEEVLNSQTRLVSLENAGDSIVVVEEYTNYIDEVLQREPRTFQVTYFVSDNKVTHAVMDTLPGYSESRKKLEEAMEPFHLFCEESGFEVGLPMNGEGALTVKEALDAYKMSKESEDAKD